MKRRSYVFDPQLRGADGHLKPVVIRALDRRAEALEKAADKPLRCTCSSPCDNGGYGCAVHGLPDDDIHETDQAYAARIDKANEALDEEWWAIPRWKRPPFSEFLKSKGVKR